MSLYPYMTFRESIAEQAMRHMRKATIYLMCGNLAYAIGSMRKYQRRMAEHNRMLETERALEVGLSPEIRLLFRKMSDQFFDAMDADLYSAGSVRRCSA